MQVGFNTESNSSKGGPVNGTERVTKVSGEVRGWEYEWYGIILRNKY